MMPFRFKYVHEDDSDSDPGDWIIVGEIRYCPVERSTYAYVYPISTRVPVFKGLVDRQHHYTPYLAGGPT